MKPVLKNHSSAKRNAGSHEREIVLKFLLPYPVFILSRRKKMPIIPLNGYREQSKTCRTMHIGDFRKIRSHAILGESMVFREVLMRFLKEFNSKAHPAY